MGRTGAAWPGTSGSPSSPSTGAEGTAPEPSGRWPQHLFVTTDVNRVEAITDVDNVAEQRALERAGFEREGVLRGAQYRGGGWHDVVLYARLREDTT